MENVQLLIPIESAEFWLTLKGIVETAVIQTQKDTLTYNHVERPLLKAKEVCEIFHISKPTIYDWLRQGKIKSVKIQSRRYFHWKDVEELIEQSKVNSLTFRP